MSAEENSTANVADALVASLGFEPTEGKKLGRKSGSSPGSTDKLSEGDSATVEDATDTPSIDDGFSVVSMDADSGNSAESNSGSSNGRSTSTTKTGSDSATKRSGGSKSTGSNRRNSRNRRARNQGQKQGQGSASKNNSGAKNTKDPMAALADIKSAAKPTVSEPAESDAITAAKAETEAILNRLDDAKRQKGIVADNKTADESDAGVVGPDTDVGANKSDSENDVASKAAITGELDRVTVAEASGPVDTAQPPPPSAADAIKVPDVAESGGLSAETIASVLPAGIDIVADSAGSDSAGTAPTADAKSDGTESRSPLASAKAKAKAKVADVAAKAKADPVPVDSEAGPEAKSAGQRVGAKVDTKVDTPPDAKVESKLDLAPLQDAPVPTEVPTAPPLVQPVEVRKPARPTAPGLLPFPNPFRRKRRVQARKVRRVIRHIDPWSVLTFSVLFHLCVFAALLLASVLVWNAAEAAGTIENLETFITELGDYDSFTIEGDTVFRAAVAIAGILTLASSVLLVLLTVVFNLISDLVGGIRLTVIEEETIRVRRRKTKG